MKTIIGIVGSNREARLRLMKELSNKLKDKGYSVILVFQCRDGEDISVPGTLVVSTLDSSTFIKADFKMTINDLKRLFPNKWCLVLAEEYKVAPYIAVATSKHDIDELGPQSLAIVLMNNDLVEFTTSLRDKIATINRVSEIIHEVLIEDIMKTLMRENCGECGFNSCKDLAEAIARGEDTPLRCAKRGERVKLMVDGDLIQLNPFTSKMFVQVLTSLLSILKGVPRSFRRVTVEVNLD
ncbi:MAG: (Fe-S)-binding protein [Candidatus Nezhaarchaeales archaeon]